jgi:transposase
MDAYSLRTRRRILFLYKQGAKTKQIAQMLSLCRAGVRRVKQHFREHGTLEPLPRKAGRRSGLTPQIQATLRHLVERQPDATLAELQSRLGVTVSLATVDRWLKKLELSYKKSRSRPRSRTGPTSKPDATSGTSS